MAKVSKKSLKDQIEKLIRTSAIAYVGLAALAILLMSGLNTNLVWEYSVTDGIATEETNQLGKAEKTFFDFEYRYVLAGVLGFSALLLILLATNYKNQYERSVKARISGFRWAYMGLSSSVLLVLIALSFGINNVATLKTISLLVILTTAFTWLADREAASTKRSGWFAFVAGLLCGTVAWLPIIGVLVGTWLFGMTNYDWYVYAAAAITLLGFTGFAYNQAMSLKQKGSWKNYEFAERNYFAIDLTTKALVAIVLIVGIAN